MLRAIVFDFDGVIANSEPLHLRAFQEVLSARGVTLSDGDYYDRHLGFDDRGVFAAIAEERRLGWGAPEVDDLVAQKAVCLARLELSESILFPGAVDLVQRLAARFPLAIASGALRNEIVRVLEHEKLAGYFLALVAAEDTPLSKPAPDPYRLAVERLSTAVGSVFQPSECIAIEDSKWGLDSARGAGLRTVAVAHTYLANDLSADLVVSNLHAITVDALQAIPL